MGEAIYCEWPQVLHVRVMFGEWDDRFLMLEMTALETWGFAQKQRPNPRCGSRWDQLRCIMFSQLRFLGSLERIPALGWVRFLPTRGIPPPNWAFFWWQVPCSITEQALRGTRGRNGKE